MTSEAFTGNWMAGRLASSVGRCCGHAHERIESDISGEVTWISGCWCGCLADRGSYEGYDTAIDDWQPKRVADVVPTDGRHDDDYDYGPTCRHGLDRATCVDFGDAERESRLGQGEHLRGGGAMARPGRDLPRWARDIRDQLVGLWRLARLWSRMGSYARPADNGGDEDPAEPTGSERLLRELVGE